MNNILNHKKNIIKINKNNKITLNSNNSEKNQNKVEKIQEISYIFPVNLRHKQQE